MSAKKKTVLVIDDEADQREQMRGTLQRESYTVLEAADYKDALAAQQRHRGEIDLVLIDLALPGGSGYELSRAMLAVEPRLRVLFISGHSGAELVKFFAAPVLDVHFLKKPFNGRELLGRVKAVMEAASSSDGG
jgi:two-component system cell cycle sensor histidine kinase/response regulator CckA